MLRARQRCAKSAVPISLRSILQSRAKHKVPNCTEGEGGTRGKDRVSQFGFWQKYQCVRKHNQIAAPLLARDRITKKRSRLYENVLSEGTLIPTRPPSRQRSQLWALARTRGREVPNDKIVKRLAEDLCNSAEIFRDFFSSYPL